MLKDLKLSLIHASVIDKLVRFIHQHIVKALDEVKQAYKQQVEEIKLPKDTLCDFSVETEVHKKIKRKFSEDLTLKDSFFGDIERMFTTPLEGSIDEKKVAYKNLRNISSNANEKKIDNTYIESIRTYLYNFCTTTLYDILKEQYLITSDKHNKSFFGQSTGMFLQSSSKTDPFIFFRFIKKKESGTWEKPSLGEGKTIKCSLEEIVMILKVLKRDLKSWSTIHVFKEEKTPISVKWEGEQKIWFNISDYPKMLAAAQIEILALLMKHILAEKIEFATSSGKSNETPSKVNDVPVDSNNDISKGNVVDDNIEIVEEIDLGDKVKKIEGIIKSETEKALLLEMNNDNEFWIPKSTIKSKYKSIEGAKQSFIIDSWILEKNKVPA